MIIEEEVPSREYINEFIEHFGTRGMRWGVRNNSSGKKASRANRRRIYSSLVVGGAVGALGARFVGTKTLSIPLALIAGGGSAAVGYNFTKKFLEKDAKSTNDYLSKMKLK